jgi:hypothetical protein
MAAWKKDELDRLASSEEVDIAPRLRDGTLGKRVTIWAVAHDDALWIRSAVKGRDAAWYRAVQASHAGRIWAGRSEKDAEFEEAGEGVADQIDAAYRKKYRQYAGRILNSCLTAEARATTLKVMPA